ncbi:MAG: hypothetical protein GX557_00725 [Chloroflexi bacterium]|nr:hypothetical protein [Chloroflexota bacterium]
MPTPSAFSLETYARNSRSYYELAVDASGLPYFDVFLADPSLLAHDWPDYGDVMARQYQAAIMYRAMTGEALDIEPVWRRNLLALLSPDDGLLYRPATSYSTHVADLGDQSLTLYALATAQLAEPCAESERVVAAMVRGLRARHDEIVRAPMGFLLKSLLAAERAVPGCGALQLATALAQALQASPGVFPPDNHYPRLTHMHGTLRALVGMADYAQWTGDMALMERMHTLYGVFRAMGTSFGFLPEAVARPGDIVTCETCALMDYVGLGVALANAGYDDCWADMEQLARNQLVESQAHDLTWLPVDDTRADTEQFSWRNLRERLVGAWAGWSSPTHFLGAEETLNHHWGGPELRDKARLLQNCCGGSGLHALFILWKNALRVSAEGIDVNLHVDKRAPEIEVLSDQPYRGHMQIVLHRPAALRVRLPEWLTDDSAVRLTRAGAVLPWRRVGLYLDAGEQPADSPLALDYPLPVRTEGVTIGNPGYQQYGYSVTWKGDTVLEMAPASEMPTQGYSDFDEQRVPVYYGEEGPGRLYQREGYRREAAPRHLPLHEDRASSLDLW